MREWITEPNDKSSSICRNDPRFISPHYNRTMNEERIINTPLLLFKKKIVRKSVSPASFLIVDNFVQPTSLKRSDRICDRRSSHFTAALQSHKRRSSSSSPINTSGHRNNAKRELIPRNIKEFLVIVSYYYSSSLYQRPR